MPICRAIPPPLGPNGRIGSFAACQIYIEGQERDRPSHTFFRGVVSLDTAALEMDAQADLSRCRDPVCHWIISYHADEPAADQVIEADTYRLLEAIELGRHQFIAAVHDDTDNRHVHVVANRVGPDGRAAQMAWYKYYSERCMAGVALSRDVPVVPGKFNRDLLTKQQAKQGELSKDQSLAPDLRARLSGRDRARLERSGDLPWYEIARPVVIEAAKSAASWGQFSGALSEHGIVLKHTVRIAGRDGRAFHGLAFAEGHEAGTPGCKASAVGSDFRYKALAARWGDYPDDAEGRARAALLARPGIPGRGEVARTHGDRREAARQRRARALGSTVAVETGARMPLGQFTNHDQARARGVGVSEEKRYPQLGAEPSAQMLTANLARSVISLPMARQAAEHILAGLRAKAGRSKRRRRMDNLQRWSSGEPTVSEPKCHPKGRRRQSGGMLRTLVQAASGEGQLPDHNIRDHHTLKQQYVAYRAKERLALKASEDGAWRRAWGQEQATRQQEINRLRRSEQVKRTLIIEGLQPGRFRRIWLEGLKLRYRFKRDWLKKCQAERWVTIRSEWIANGIREQPLGYKKWLRESAVADPVAARQYAWIDSMDARRAVGMVAPAAQDAEHDERLMELSDPDTALPDRATSAEPGGQPKPDPVSNSDVERTPVNRSRGDFRLLAAAKFMAERAGDLNNEMVEDDKDGAESAVEADPAVWSRLRDVDDHSAASVSGVSPEHAGAAPGIAAPQVETMYVAAGTSLHRGMDPGASGIEGTERDRGMSSDAEHQGTEDAQPSHARFSIAEQAREVELRSQTRAVTGGVKSGGLSRNPSQEARATTSGAEEFEGSARMSNGAEHQEREVTQVSQSTIDFRVQAREVALRSQAQDAQGGIVPGSTSEDLGQENRGTDQTLELKAPTSPALPTTAGRTVELPKTPDRPGPSHRPSDQGEASAPLTPVASGPIRSPTPAPELSEAKPPAPVEQLAPEQVPTALQAMVQPGPEHNAAPADAGSTTAQASAPILAPEPLAPAAPSLAPARASDAAMRAAAALRVQRLPIGPDPLREIVKGADQPLNQVQAATAPSASSPAQTDQPIQLEPFNPITDKDGRRHNPLLQQIAATIIHAFDRDDEDLGDAAGTLLGVYLDEQEETAVYVAVDIVEWHKKPNAWPNMPRPLSKADCGKVTERIVAERQAGRGDNWMWSWKGLPPDRVPPRPKPGSRKGSGIGD